MMKNTYYENIIQRRTGELYEYRTKIDFKKKKIVPKEKGHLMMIKWPACQEDILLNSRASNNRIQSTWSKSDMICGRSRQLSKNSWRRR